MLLPWGSYAPTAALPAGPRDAGERSSTFTNSDAAPWLALPSCVDRVDAVCFRCPRLPEVIGRLAAVVMASVYCTNRTVVDVWTGKVDDPPFSIRPLKSSRNP